MSRVLRGGIVATAAAAVLCGQALAGGDNGDARVQPVSGAKPPMKAAPMKSNGSGVLVRYRVDATSIEAGRPVPIVLSFENVTDPAGATVRLSTDGGLSLGATVATHVLPPGTATTLTVEVVPAGDAVGYLHVFTTQRGASSATSIAIGKGASALPPSSDLKQTPGGDTIRQMPVK